MKSLLVVVVLASLSISNEAAAVQNDAAAIVVNAHPPNVSVGKIGKGDRLMARNYLSKTAIKDTIQHQDLTFRGGSSVVIAAVMVTEVGNTQGAAPEITSGGVGKNFVTIKVTSAKGKGYSYTVDIYGHG